MCGAKVADQSLHPETRQRVEGREWFVEQEKPGLGPKIDRSASAIVEPELPATVNLAAPVAPPAGPTSVTVVAPTTSFDTRPWYAFAATVVIGLVGIVYLRLRGGPTA